MTPVFRKIAYGEECAKVEKPGVGLIDRERRGQTFGDHFPTGTGKFCGVQEEVVVKIYCKEVVQGTGKK